MLEIAVIADDLTGAADTGIQFRPLFAETLLMADTALTGDHALETAQALAVHTRTRAAAPDAARERVAAAATALGAWKPGRLYKKVDSCLRGNIGAEAEAIMEALGLELSFIAPAFPAVGRTTVGDVHLVKGEPVAETEMGRDPATPVTESRLSRVVAAQCRLPVGHVDLEAVAAGPAECADAVARLAGGGARHIVFDVTEQEHLKTIAGLTVERFPHALPVGSAGLALGLRDSLPAPAPLAAAAVPHAAGHHLVALGTASATARRQTETLCQARPFFVFEVAAAELVGGTAQCRLDEAIAALGSGDAVVRIARPQGDPDAGTAGRVAAAFGAFVAELVRRSRPASVFLSGGDTAVAVLDTLGARALRLESELVPGLVRGSVVGGEVEGLAVGTKPGAFGDDDAILKWREFWS